MTHPEPRYETPLPGSFALRYASWGQRVGAYLLDWLVMLPPYAVALVGLSIGEQRRSRELNPATNEVEVTTYTDPSATGWTVFGVFMAAFVCLAIWNVLLRPGHTGYSLGRQWVGIKLVKAQTGLPVGVPTALGRQLAHVVDSLACYLGWLWPLWDEKGQTFADKICSTVVVQEPYRR